MEERLRFVARLLDGEKMAPLCREFGIARKTGYKIFNRYKGCGIEGLTDRSRRPYRYANQLPFQIVGTGPDGVWLRRRIVRATPGRFVRKAKPSD